MAITIVSTILGISMVVLPVLFVYAIVLLVKEFISILKDDETEELEET